MDDERDEDCVVIVTGAARLARAAIDAIPVDAIVVAADGGLDHALAAGLTPDVLIGDLDSVSAEGRAWAEANAEIVTHPADKAATDTELAVAHAASRRPRRLLMLAGSGDRVDHTIAAIGALGSPTTSAVPRVGGWWGGQELLVVRPDRPVSFDAAPGTTFSVLALHGPCTGVDVSGARWPLAGADLGPVVGLGVSNEVATSPVSIAVADGVLTVTISRGPR
ncbi:thiamine diphosphokinase [Desertimonas flava]|uniref:thiamine diphosphokinase n=1 Tax=Desertimonas flava TaxID=2064846 RepID=UPI000E34ACE2|nr:thiamine diphosphokinase [Desertimonas flava]